MDDDDFEDFRPELDTDGGVVLCQSCRSDNTMLTDTGEYVCLDCGTQSQDTRNLTQEEFDGSMSRGINGGLIRRRQFSDGSHRKIRFFDKPQPEHTFNMLNFLESMQIMLKRMTRDLIENHNQPSVIDQCVKEIWILYLKRWESYPLAMVQVIGGRLCNSGDNAYFARAYISGVAPPPILPSSFQLLLAILYTAGRIVHTSIQPYDIIRWCNEGSLTFFRAIELLDPDRFLAVRVCAHFFSPEAAPTPEQLFRTSEVLARTIGCYPLPSLHSVMPLSSIELLGLFFVNSDFSKTFGSALSTLNTGGNASYELAFESVYSHCVENIFYLCSLLSHEHTFPNAYKRFVISRGIVDDPKPNNRSSRLFELSKAQGPCAMLAAIVFAVINSARSCFQEFFGSLSSFDHQGLSKADGKDVVGIREMLHRLNSRVLPLYGSASVALPHEISLLPNAAASSLLSPTAAGALLPAGELSRAVLPSDRSQNPSNVRTELAFVQLRDESVLELIDNMATYGPTLPSDMPQATLPSHHTPENGSDTAVSDLSESLRKKRKRSSRSESVSINMRMDGVLPQANARTVSVAIGPRHTLEGYSDPVRRRQLWPSGTSNIFPVFGHLSNNFPKMAFPRINNPKSKASDELKVQKCSLTKQKRGFEKFNLLQFFVVPNLAGSTVPPDPSSLSLGDVHLLRILSQITFTSPESILVCIEYVQTIMRLY